MLAVAQESTKMPWSIFTVISVGKIRALHFIKHCIMHAKLETKLQVGVFFILNLILFGFCAAIHKNPS